MDKYEFNIKVEQIKKLMKKKDFITAVKIADTIDWDKVKDNQLLIMVADVYEIAGRYDAARDALLTAYERTGLGRQLAYRLCRLSVKRGDIAEAKEFYEEFTENSPRDAGCYILQYEMAKGAGEPISKQIDILETYIEADMDDKWAYELAKLYHKAQMSEKCVELCDTIILWFADGKYVEKALELKQLYVPLSEHQRLKYEAQKSRKPEVVSGSTTKIIEEAVQKVIEQESEPPVQEITAGENTVYIIPPVEEKKPEKIELEFYRDEVPPVQPPSMMASAQQVELSSDEIPDGEILDEVHEMDFDVNNVHFKDYSVHNRYDTVNIQKELAQSVSSLFDNTGELFKPIPRHSAEPEEEKVDDQITGQMNLEEVLAMFEAGEFSKKEEPSVEETAPADEEVPMVEEEASVEEEALEEEESPVLEEVPVEEEAPVEEVSLVDTEEIVGDTEIEELSIEVAEEVAPDEIEELEDIEDEVYEELEEDDVDDESDVLDEFPVEDDIEEKLPEEQESEEQESEEQEPEEEPSEEEIIADIIANEIIFDVTEEIEEQRAEEIIEAKEEIEELIEESIEAESEEQLESDEQVEEETAEEDSEVAESEIQEREPIMFDLKNDFEEESKDEISEPEIEEEVLEPEEDAISEVEEVEEIAESEEEIETSEAEAYEEEISEPQVEDEATKTKPVPKRQIIPPEAAKEELKKFIARFTGVQGLDKQILKVMQNTLKGDDKPVKYIFVKGEVKSGKTTLAIDVLKLANKMMQRRDQKIAKIKAESINGKSIDALLEKLEGSDVLIEKVSDMYPETFAEFIDKLNGEGADRFVIFEDEKHLADEFLEKVPERYREFANILDIKQNKIKDWTKMASDYAKSKGYAFDEMGILALSAKIDQLRAITLVVHKNHVEQVVDGAIKKANKFSLGKLFGRPKNEEGLKLLTEKDFID